MGKKKVNLNFKVDEEMKILLNELVIIKTVKDHKKSSQHDVFQEALITLMQKYNLKIKIYLFFSHIIITFFIFFNVYTILYYR